MKRPDVIGDIRHLQDHDYLMNWDGYIDAFVQQKIMEEEMDSLDRINDNLSDMVSANEEPAAEDQFIDESQSLHLYLDDDSLHLYLDDDGDQDQIEEHEDVDLISSSCSQKKSWSDEDPQTEGDDDVTGQKKFVRRQKGEVHFESSEETSGQSSTGSTVEETFYKPWK
jgi:hypothetical protein